MILCHKCCGILASGTDEDTSGLFGCGCMSGYVRGFEPDFSRKESVEAQTTETQERVRLYVSQGRDSTFIASVRERLAKLKQL